MRISFALDKRNQTREGASQRYSSSFSSTLRFVIAFTFYITFSDPANAYDKSCNSLSSVKSQFVPGNEFKQRGMALKHRIHDAYSISSPIPAKGIDLSGAITSYISIGMLDTEAEEILRDAGFKIDITQRSNPGPDAPVISATIDPYTEGLLDSTDIVVIIYTTGLDNEGRVCRITGALFGDSP